MELLELAANGTTFMVVDESLKIKNWGAKRTKRIIEIGKKCEYRLVLNGTPITRNLLDIWAQFEFLSPKILGMCINQFTSTFCEIVKITKRHNGRTIKNEFIAGYHNVDYLYSLIGHYVYECSLDLSVSQSHTEVIYEVLEEEKVVYDKIKERYLNEEILLKMNNKIFMEMTQKMQHSYCCAADKFLQLEKLLKEFDNDKVLVYTKYIKTRESIQEKYPHITVLSYGKHSYGLNLQNCNVTIYFDKTFDYSQMIQSEFRTYRTGQQSDCRYIHFTGNIGLDRLMDKNISQKVSLSEYFKQVGIEYIKNLL